MKFIKINNIFSTELLRFGVKVIILEPGFFKTPLTDEEQTLKMLEKVWDEALPQVRDEYGSDLYEFSGFCTLLKPPKQYYF